MSAKGKNFMGNGRITMWNTAISACLVLVLFSTVAIAHGDKKMESKYLYEVKDFDSAQSIQPQTFKSKE